MAHVSRSRLNYLFVVPLLLVFAVVPRAFARESLRKVPVGVSKPVTRASWYGKSFKGKPTASGALFNPRRFTAAHRTINIGSRVKVTELRSGRSVVVEITDRGPFFPGRDIDLSYAAARELGIVQRGVARVRVEVLYKDETLPPPVVTACSWPTTPWLPQAVVE